MNDVFDLNLADVSKITIEDMDNCMNNLERQIELRKKPTCKVFF